MTPSLEDPRNILNTLSFQDLKVKVTGVSFYKTIVIALALLFMYQFRYNFTQMFSVTVSRTTKCFSEVVEVDP